MILQKDGYKLHISLGNSKLKNIANVSLIPIVTCPRNIPCRKKCYALKFVRARKIVRKAWTDNTKLWQEKPKLFETLLISFLERYKNNYFRWFVGGDIPDRNFYKMIVRIAKRFKQIRFLVYTKRYAAIKAYSVSRSTHNLVVAASVWKGENKKLTALNAPKVWYLDSTVTYPSSWYLCPGSCAKCHYCYHMKPGDNVIIKAH